MPLNRQGPGRSIKRLRRNGNDESVRDKLENVCMRQLRTNEMKENMDINREK